MSSKAQTSEKDYERGLRIADRRKVMGLSQDELAHRAGIGRQALSAIENGGDFKTQTLDNLAIVLGVSVDFIMYGKNEENSELLSEAIRYMRAGKADALIVANLDAISDGIADSYLKIGVVREAGFRLFSVDEKEPKVDLYIPPKRGDMQ